MSKDILPHDSRSKDFIHIPRGFVSFPVDPQPVACIGISDESGATCCVWVVVWWGYIVLFLMSRHSNLEHHISQYILEPNPTHHVSAIQGLVGNDGWATGRTSGPGMGAVGKYGLALWFRCAIIVDP